jgi:hypothetical protein
MEFFLGNCWFLTAVAIFLVLLECGDLLYTLCLLNFHTNKNHKVLNQECWGHRPWQFTRSPKILRNAFKFTCVVWAVAVSCWKTLLYVNKWKYIIYHYNLFHRHYPFCTRPDLKQSKWGSYSKVSAVGTKWALAIL